MQNRISMVYSYMSSICLFVYIRILFASMVYLFKYVKHVSKIDNMRRVNTFACWINIA